MVKYTLLLFFILHGLFSFAADDGIHHTLDQKIALAWKLSTTNGDTTMLIVNSALEKAETDKALEQKAELLRIKGLVYFYRVDYAQSLEFFIKSRDLYISIGNNLGEALALNNIQLLYRKQGFLPEALIMSRKVLSMMLGIGDSARIAQGYNNLAVVYSDINKLDSALQFYKKAVQISVGANDVESLDLYYNNVGNTYMKLGIPDSAIIFYNKSLEVGRQLNDLQMICNALNSIGEYYLSKKSYLKAMEYLDESLLIAKQIGIVYEIESAYENLHKAYVGTGNYKAAYNALNLHHIMGDSANDMLTMHKISEIETATQVRKEKQLQKLIQEKKDLELSLQMKNQKIIRNSALLIVLILIIYSYFLYRQFRKRGVLNVELTNQRDEIFSQKEEIEAQHDTIFDKNKVLEFQKMELSTHRKNTLDSLQYAEHIQSSLLPNPLVFEKAFKDSFILYKPKDIVSGDFYWFKDTQEELVIAGADCTGHGVPGAFMSVMGISFLNEIYQKERSVNPAIILEELREQVKLTLNPDLKKHKSKNYIDLYLDIKIKDGIDIALCSINKKTNILSFSGANRPLFILRNKEIIELKPNDNPLGVSLVEYPFINQEFQLQADDMLYLFSDGYYDQFGGKWDKKFMLEPFKELLLSIYKIPCHSQQQVLNDTIAEWQGINEQIDDIMVMGIRI